MTRPRKLIAAGLTAAALACATSAQTPAAATPSAAAAQHACFYSRNVDNFTAVDDKTVLLRVGVNDIYRLTLFAPCPDIDFNESIGMRSRASSWVCEGTNTDLEVFSHSPIGRQRCPVSEVHRLSAEEVAALPKKQRP